MPIVSAAGPVMPAEANGYTVANGSSGAIQASQAACRSWRPAPRSRAALRSSTPSAAHRDRAAKASTRPSSIRRCRWPPRSAARPGAESGAGRRGNRRPTGCSRAIPPRPERQPGPGNPPAGRARCRRRSTGWPAASRACRDPFRRRWPPRQARAEQQAQDDLHDLGTNQAADEQFARPEVRIEQGHEHPNPGDDHGDAHGGQGGQQPHPDEPAGAHGPPDFDRGERSQQGVERVHGDRIRRAGPRFRRRPL